MAHAIVHTTFSVLGLYTRAEVSTARGRADLTVAEALAQIETRGYARAYADDVREVVRVGMVFDLEARRIVDWGEA